MSHRPCPLRRAARARSWSALIDTSAYVMRVDPLRAKEGVASSHRDQWRLFAPGGIPEGELVAARGEEGVGHATAVARFGGPVGERPAPGGELAELGAGVLVDPARVELVGGPAALGEEGGELVVAPHAGQQGGR